VGVSECSGREGFSFVRVLYNNAENDAACHGSVGLTVQTWTVGKLESTGEISSVNLVTFASASVRRLAQRHSFERVTFARCHSTSNGCSIARLLVSIATGSPGIKWQSAVSLIVSLVSICRSTLFQTRASPSATQPSGGKIPDSARPATRIRFSVVTGLHAPNYLNRISIFSVNYQFGKMRQTR
jgi:hypothetical protein